MAANSTGQSPGEFTAWNAGIYRRFQKGDAPQQGQETVLRAAACKNEDVPFQLAAARAGGGAHLRVKCTALVSEQGEIPPDPGTAPKKPENRC